MAQPTVRKAFPSDVTALGESAREDFTVILDKLDSALKAGSKIFPSGIELIKLTVKAGTNIEFSVVLAGKDAPKVGELVSTLASSLPPAKA